MPWDALQTRALLVAFLARERGPAPRNRRDGPGIGGGSGRQAEFRCRLAVIHDPGDSFRPARARLAEIPYLAELIEGFTIRGSGWRGGESEVFGERGSRECRRGR